jgi:hypothetical protein
MRPGQVIILRSPDFPRDRIPLYNSPRFLASADPQMYVASNTVALVIELSNRDPSPLGEMTCILLADGRLMWVSNYHCNVGADVNQTNRVEVE